MKSILLFGAYGSLGQAIIQVFSSDQYQLHPVDREHVDITDESAVRDVVQTINPDIMINVAAINAVDDIETNDDIFAAATKVNGEAPGMLARIAKESGALFVHYSTDYVFDGSATEPITEDVAPNPISRYAETKRLGEQTVTEAGGNYYIIRLSRLFGTPGVGDSAKRSFVDLMHFLATDAGKTSLNVVNDQIASPTYAPDLAVYTKSLIEQHAPSGIYHGANSGQCSWFEFATEIFRLYNIDIDLTPVPHTEFPRPAQAPAYSALANTKGPHMRSWQDGLAAYISSQQS